MTTTYESLFELVVAAVGDRADAATDFLDLFDEAAVLEYPFAPPGTPERLEGRSAIAAHAELLAPSLDFGRFVLSSVVRADDKVIFEASCEGRGVRTGAAYDQRYVCVVTLRDGKIVHYSDYWNPLVLISALGGAEGVRRAYSGPSVLDSDDQVAV
jgi:hypothetical protein